MCIATVFSSSISAMGAGKSGTVNQRFRARELGVELNIVENAKNAFCLVQSRKPFTSGG